MSLVQLKGLHNYVGWSAFGSCINKQMNGILGHDSALQGYTVSGTTWDNQSINQSIIYFKQWLLIEFRIQYAYTRNDPNPNEMNFVMHDAPGAGSIFQNVDQQSRTLQLYHGSPLAFLNTASRKFLFLSLFFPRKWTNKVKLENNTDFQYRERKLQSPKLPGCFGNIDVHVPVIYLTLW